MIRLNSVGKFWLTYLVLLAIVLFFTYKAIASPFLVCDPQDNVEWYEILGLGVDGEQIPATPSNGQVYLRHDLAGTTVGTTYSIAVRACNVWGCSEDTPFSFTPENAPSSLQNLGIVP